MSFTINETISWVGKKDWEIRKFHGEEYSTHRGSSYNSYLVRDEKIALIDTVWAPFADEFVSRLGDEVELGKIDYIIANHAEPDHSGALPELMKAIPGTPIYCTANAVKSLTGHYHQDWNFQIVKSGDRLSLGGKELIFIEAPMLHWPDSMFCYLTGEQVLFSNDAFGHHLASEHMYNDQVDRCELYQECIKYYANILTPFSRQVARKIEEFVGLNLPVKMICPSHGIIWREDPLQIVTQYAAWANEYRENQITVIYDTMWDSTRKMAEALAAGIRSADPAVTVKLYNAGRGDKNDIITEVFRSKAILVGSPTINRGILSAAAAILEEMKGLGFKGKKAAAFGSYGWSGEGIKIISSRLNEAGFEVINEGVRTLWNPDDKSLDGCFKFGASFAEQNFFQKEEE
ncbi:MAG: anaerobic nitric oxide reductase flavorubredoxin [Proteobacteria bacterium]|nr:anaerobic nitric oxide reductase flavorubredoxin [Pseudomonadota bacterium]MBU1685796.1 anaerobic nitric oxide reductase flavorubredoxin [Pseudomonadota bacterium]